MFVTKYPLGEQVGWRSDEPFAHWAARGKDNTKTVVVVAVRRGVVVAVRGTAVLRVVVPVAAAFHAVRARLCHTTFDARFL